MIITSKTIEWKEKIPKVNLRIGCKMTACSCDAFSYHATALEAVLLIAPGIDVIYRKKQYDLDMSYTHKKRKQYKHG